MNWKILMDEENDNGAGGGTTDTQDPPATPKTEEETAEQKIARLTAENAALKANPPAAPAAQPAAPTAPTPLTSAQLENYSAEQWNTIEERTGKTKEQIIRDFKDHELTTRQNTLDAKNNTTEALQDAIEANPKLIKLRASIKEFLDDVPIEDKLNPAKLKRHMEKAITYAKGKHMTTTPETPTPKAKGGETPSPKGGGTDDDGGDDTVVDGEIKNDDYVSDTGLHIKTGKVDKGTWKQIRHKTKDPNSISIPGDFDKPPSFK